MTTQEPVPDVGDVRYAPGFDAEGRGVSFFAKDSNGQWYYVNHADTWQACPPPAEST